MEMYSLVRVTKNDVFSMNYKSVVSKITECIPQSVSHPILITFEGFDADKEEVYENSLVRKFVKKMVLKFNGWLQPSFCPETIKLITACLYPECVLLEKENYSVFDLDLIQHAKTRWSNLMKKMDLASNSGNISSRILAYEAFPYFTDELEFQTKYDQDSFLFRHLINNVYDFSINAKSNGNLIRFVRNFNGSTELVFVFGERRNQQVQILTFDTPNFNQPETIDLFIARVTEIYREITSL